MWASVIALPLVNVLRKDKVVLPEQGAEEPELGPMAITTLLSGSKGFTPAGTSS